MKRGRSIPWLSLWLLWPWAVCATEAVRLIEVDVLPATTNHWAATLNLSGAGFEVRSVALDPTRFYVDISPANWPGSEIERTTEGGISTLRWAQFSTSPPTVRFVVEHQAGWQCDSETNGSTVAVACRAGSTTAEPGETDLSDGCEAVVLVRGLELCTPLRGLGSADILARSLEYLPTDVVRDGLPHFGALRGDWKGRPRPHKGLDIYVDECDVLAMATGEVSGVGLGPKAGGWVKLAHGSGVETVYVHVARILVKRGERVVKGHGIGWISGAVGNAVEAQLHLEIKIDGQAVDPAPLLAAAAPPGLKPAWQRAISSIPQRVDRRKHILEAQRTTGR